MEKSEGEESGARKKRKLTCDVFNANREGRVELDPTSLAFLDPLCDDMVPDLKYTRQDYSTKRMILPVKSRVVAFYDVKIEKSDQHGKISEIFKTEYFCAGTITEAPSLHNNFRFLVFFDNGYSKYTKLKFTYPIFDQFTTPIDRLHKDHIYFMRDRFERYPEQLVAKLSPNDYVDFYFDNQW